jgi:hypothetical protein
VTSQTALAASQSHDDTSNTEGVEDICFIYLILCGHIDINLGFSAYCGVLFHHCISHQCHHDSKQLYVQLVSSVSQ